APEADGDRQAEAGRRLEAAQARGQGAQAAGGPAEVEEGGEGRRETITSSGPVSVDRSSREDELHATGKRRREDAPATQEDSQEGQGLFRWPAQALPHSGRNGAARRGLRLSGPEAEEAARTLALDRAHQRGVPARRR